MQVLSNPMIHHVINIVLQLHLVRSRPPRWMCTRMYINPHEMAVQTYNYYPKYISLVGENQYPPALEN